MTSRHEHHRRRSIRLRAYDYRDTGAYFVTICVRRREPMFGLVTDGFMRPNSYGKIAYEEWWRTMDVRPNVELLPFEFVVMPDHVHGIVRITGRGAGPIVDRDAAPMIDGTVGAQRRCAPTDRGIDRGMDRGMDRGVSDPATIGLAVANRGMRRGGGAIGVLPGSLGAIVRAYKSAVARRINAARGSPGAGVWQRNYHERVIRDEAELGRVRAYIANNPARVRAAWAKAAGME